MDILCAELRRWSLLGVNEIQSRGLGIVDAASNIAVEAEVESLLVNVPWYTLRQTL